METSLRTRPSQAPRKTPTKPTKSSSSNKNRIDDKIKKRMSARYADFTSPTDLSAIPAMPSLTAAQSSVLSPRDGDEDLRDRTRNRDDARAASDDKKLLNAENFDPAAYLKLKLANSTEDELKTLQSSLRSAVTDTSSELQRSVFKNYAEFVLISKEISVLENEMLELKDLLSDYKSMPSTLHIPDPTSISSSTLSTYKRSSVADLRVLYFNQMQNLHASIEGASKFVPTTPGRHVIGEMEGIFSLNAATYKVTGKVKFVVLDDAVLVAKRRRRNAGQGQSDGGSTVNEGKLVAEKCWPLSEMLVLDTKDSPTMTNVFKIRHGKETHVYRTEIPSDKKSLLSQFRHVAEELSQKRRKEREGEHERRKSMWQGTGSGGRSSPAPPVPDWMAELAKKGGDIPGLGTDAKEKAEKDARWVGEWSDDLTVAISLKEWAKAVDLVEQGQAKLSVTPLLSTKLPLLMSQLITSLLASLALLSNRKSTVISLISLLSRLKAGAAARNTFLEMRTRVIHGLMRKIRFEGHIGTYIGELAIVYFTGIKHTADWYLASFKENEVASSFITWTKNQLEGYCEIFRKQVYSKDVDPRLVEDAISITHTQSKRLLQEYGLDFRYLLDDLLLKNPKQPSKTASAFSFSEQRLSKDISSATFAKQLEQPSSSSSSSPPSDLSSLPPAPQMPTLHAPPPPVNRRRSPGPKPPPPALPPASSASSDSSAFSGMGRYEDTPLFSARQNTPSNPLRSRTPVSAAQQLQQQAATTTPVSAPIPIQVVASPLPRPPMSATPYRSGPGERYDGFRDKEGDYGMRPPRSARASPVPRSPAPRSPAPLPPRSANRPGSSMGQRTPVAAFAQREGMI